MANEPIVTRLPDTKKALENKYRRNPNLIDPASPIANALQALDIQRVGRGQQPMSVRQHQLALAAGINNKSSISTPDRGIFHDFTRNIREITGSIPRLPHALLKEFRALPDAPGAVSAALQSDGDILDRISKVAATPGIRLLPGAFVAENIKTPGELWDNPLFTLLDVLPAKNAPVVRKGAAKLADQIRPHTAPFTEPIGEALRTSRPGQLIRETFSNEARDLAETLAVKNRELNDAIHGTKPSNDPLVVAARESARLATKYSDLTEARRVELTRIMQSDADEIARLPVNEQAFVNEVRDITDRMGQIGVSEGLLGVVDGEFYTAKDAGKILKARQKKVIAQDFQTARKAALNGGDIPELLTSARAILDRQDLKPGAKTKLIEGYAHAIETSGTSAQSIFAAIRDANKSKSLTPIANAIDNFDGAPITVRSVDELIAEVSKHRKDPQAARILDHMKAGRWKEAQTIAKRVATRKNFPIPGIDEVVERAAILKSRDRFLKTTSKFDDKRVAKLSTIADREFTRNVPARFQPKLQEKVNAEVQTLLADDVNIPEVMTALREKNYGWLKKNGYIDEVEFRRINDEIFSGWQELKASGYDPVFVHHMSEGAVFSLKYPRVLEHIPTPTSARARINDLTPYLDDVSIALPHQALEYLVRRGSDEFIRTMTERWGRTADDVLDDYLPAARQIAKSDAEVLTVAQRLMDREWTKYTSTNIVNFGPAKLSQWATDNNILLPKTVANNVQRMHTPPGGRISAIMDPIMNVFRTSLLPLSPRWHMYNILGGGMMVTMTADPTVFRFAKQAWEMVGGNERFTGKAWQYSDDLPSGQPRGSATVPPELQNFARTAGVKERIGAAFHHAGGQTMRRLWDEVQEAKGAGKVKDKLGRVIERSYDINGMFDDMYRTMSYLYGKDKALTKGMSKEAAERAGVELARKTLQNIDRMTPIERSILRNVFPFYGWMQHIIRYSLKYPIDHPFRTAVMGSFARNEIDDMGDALPYRFLNTFFLGDMNSEGNVKALNLAGMNPFSDVSNYFTLSGFLGQTNPILSSLLQSAGVDPGTGAPELFPTLRYDPEIGRLSVKAENPLKNFINATIPQTRVLDGMFDASSEFQLLLRSNPEAAGRLLISQAGLPVLMRNINVPQEIAKAEIAREEDRNLVLGNALKTGDYSEANRYPDLVPILQQIQSLQNSGGIAPFKIDETLSPQQSAIEAGQESLLVNLGLR